MKSIYVRKGLVAIACAFTITGCQSTANDNQSIGMATGAILGGLIGTQIGDGTGRTVAIASGALLGGWLGSEIAAMLSQSEQKELNQTTGKTLNDVPDNQTVEWKSRETDSTVKMTPTNTESKSRNSSLVKLKEVQAPPKMKLINQPYISTTSANVRSGAGTQYPLVGGLQPGESFYAVGKVVGSPWVVVAKNNVTLGYVHQDLVAPQSATLVSATSQSNNQPVIREQITATNVDQIQLPATELDDITLGGEPIVVDVDVQEVAVESTCRTMTYEMDQNQNAAKKESFEVCEATDGAWEII
ncbi:SH3 domain-containing protein [Shewanella sp. 125m-1]